MGSRGYVGLYRAIGDRIGDHIDTYGIVWGRTGGWMRPSGLSTWPLVHSAWCMALHGTQCAVSPDPWCTVPDGAARRSVPSPWCTVLHSSHCLNLAARSSVHGLSAWRCRVPLRARPSVHSAARCSVHDAARRLVHGPRRTVLHGPPCTLLQHVSVHSLRCTVLHACRAWCCVPLGTQPSVHGAAHARCTTLGAQCCTPSVYGAACPRCTTLGAQCCTPSVHGAARPRCTTLGARCCNTAWRTVQRGIRCTALHGP